MNKPGIHLVSTLHDPEGDWLKFALDHRVPKRVVSEFGWWGVAVTRQTYDAHNALIQELRQKGVVVEREAAGRFSADKIRNNHACALNLGRQVMGDGRLFYADADRVLADVAATLSLLPDFVKGLRFCIQGEAAETDLLSIIRNPASEIISRRYTEIPLNVLMSEVVGCCVDPLGSYVVMSRRMADLAIETARERGLSFPASEWMIRAKEAGFGIGGYYPFQEVGGFESPAVVDWPEMEVRARKLLQWERENDPMAAKYWLSRGTRAENLLWRVRRRSVGAEDRTGLLWGRYRDQVSLSREWEGRLNTGRGVLAFIGRELAEKRLVLASPAGRVLDEVRGYYRGLERLLESGTKGNGRHISDEVLEKMSSEFDSLEANRVLNRWRKFFAGFDRPYGAIGEIGISYGTLYAAGKTNGRPVLVEDPPMRHLLNRIRGRERGLPSKEAG